MAIILRTDDDLATVADVNAAASSVVLALSAEIATLQDLIESSGDAAPVYGGVLS